AAVESLQVPRPYTKEKKASRKPWAARATNGGKGLLLLGVGRRSLAAHFFARALRNVLPFGGVVVLRAHRAAGVLRRAALVLTRLRDSIASFGARRLLGVLGLMGVGGETHRDKAGKLCLQGCLVNHANRSFAFVLVTDTEDHVLAHDARLVAPRR